MGGDDIDARWEDQDYLRRIQYRDSSNLAMRANLHVKYGRGGWFVWHAAQFDWPADADVLEVGCGSGAFWLEAAAYLPAGLRPTLTDFSPGMVAETLARVRAHWPHARGEVADAGALAYPDESFDVVIANHMLYHVPEPARGVAEIQRVLRPGGAALIATNGRAHMRRLFELRAQVFGGAPVDTISGRFPLEDCEDVLRRQFGAVALRPFPDTLRCTDARDVFAYLTSAPPGADASEEQLIRLRTVIDEAFEQAGGVLAVEKSVGLFVCRK